MSACHALDDSQSQTGATGIGAGIFQTGKWPFQTFDFIFRNARAIIANFKVQPAGLNTGTQGDFGAAIFSGIVDQVGQRPDQCLGAQMNFWQVFGNVCLKRVPKAVLTFGQR